MASWFIDVNLQMVEEQSWKQHQEKDKGTKYNKVRSVFVVNNQ